MFPGSSTMNQLDKIMEVTGRPTPEDIEATESPFASMMLDSLQPKTGKALSEIYPNALLMLWTFSRSYSSSIPTSD